MNWSLPETVAEFTEWGWGTIAPYYEDLQTRQLTSSSIGAWLENWSQLKAFIQEAFAWLDIAAPLNPEDETLQQRRRSYFEEICQPAWAIDANLENRWIESGLAALGYENQLKNLTDAKTRYWSENTDLEAEENKLTGEYVGIYSSIKVTWEGKEINRLALRENLLKPDRQFRKGIWQVWQRTQQKKRSQLEKIWLQLVEVRHQMARNAGFPNYIEFCWQREDRSYPSAAYQEFQVSILESVVPAATRIYHRYRNDLGVESLRPWDLSDSFGFSGPPYPLGTSALHPHQTIAELTGGVSRIFHCLAPKLGEYFDTLNAEGYLDLEPRPSKGPGGHARHLAVSRRSIISMAVTNRHGDLMGLIHEVGHTFALIETAHRSFLQLSLGSGGGGEWTEFEAQTMEFLALPFLHIDHGGFYDNHEAALAQIDRLEGTLLFWAHIGLVDRFEHWAYTHPNEGTNAEHCRHKWQELWNQYLPGIEWGGYENEFANNWAYFIPMFVMPLYYAGYGTSLLGSVQLWQRAQHDLSGAVAAYRNALSQGGLGLSIPEMYQAAGVTIQFDTDSIQALVKSLEMASEKWRNLSRK